MALQLGPFQSEGLTPELIEALLEEHASSTRPRLERLWAYYRNPVGAHRPTATLNHSARGTCEGHAAGCAAPASMSHSAASAQAMGLPTRLRCAPEGDAPGGREIVVENDIGWRIDALVDFVFGAPVRLRSLASDEERAERIKRILDAVWEASGGIQLLQDTAQLGSVYGYADLLLRTEDLFDAPAPARDSLDGVLERARRLRIELIEAPRATPVLDPHDYRRIVAYLIRSEVQTNRIERSTMLSRVIDRVAPRSAGSRRARSEALEIISAAHHQAYIDGELVSDAPGRLSGLPLVHIQNASQPFRYEGLSDVEPLIAIQDELNTRLSDRAHRVTMQSFSMYLAKGLEDLGRGSLPLRIGPGQVWTTDTPAAEIQTISADASSPSEDAHVEQLRDAMDKISAVSPVAIGVIRARLGHLSSENALRIALMGVLSKTERKRSAYGRGIKRMSALVLEALDAAGVFPTAPSEREIRLDWPDPLPVDERSRLRGALLKRELGVEQREVIEELGYARSDGGVE